MKKGFAVVNVMTYDSGCQIFGVYRSMEKAEKVLKKVEKKLKDELTDEDSLRIIYFEGI